MQRVIIVIVIIMFLISTVGMYMVAFGPQVEPGQERRQQLDVETAQPLPVESSTDEPIP